LTTNKPSAAKRPASPSASSSGSTSSPAVPSSAATSGGSSGTWYSSANSATVVSQSRSLVSPEAKKAWATYKRAASRASGCSDSSAVTPRCVSA
jgi:hypothetical protein